MSERTIHDRLDELEREIKAVRAELGLAPPRQEKAPSRAERLAKFALANWVLLSFFAAMGTAAYVKIVFGVDYFRDYRNLQTINSLSDFYTQLGDTLMARTEFTAAQDAYRSALQIKPGNVAATLGIIKAGVFEPPTGEDAYVPEVTDAKLNYLMSHYGDDDQVLFLKGLRTEHRGEPEAAKLLYEKAIAKNPKSLGSYLELGYMNMGDLSFNIEEAARNLNKAVELDPTLPVAHMNLGYLCLYVLDYEAAIRHLRESFQLSPTWVAAVGLADAYRYQGDSQKAIAWRRIALKGAEDAKSKIDHFAGGQSLMAEMPLQRGDRETIENNVYVTTLEDKKVFTHYGLSMDYGVQGDLANASAKFEVACALDKDAKYGAYFAQAISSVMNVCNVSETARRWFEERRRELIR